MGGYSFWLIYIQDNQVTVSLISHIDHRYQILASGPPKEWDINSESSLATATDESLSVASLNANISEDQEPSIAAFVVPPFWVDSDGKIAAPKLKLIKIICKELKLSPSGFLAEDEAIVEEANQVDGFPASFILLHLSGQEFYLSLVYLGHIKERIRKSFNGEFQGQILESALLELNSESTLPPQIIVFGQTDESIIAKLKSFPWIGKKNIETFLHFPEIKYLYGSDIINTFAKVITSQVKANIDNTSITPTDESIPIEEDNTLEELSLEETDAQQLGFSATEDLSDQLSPTPINDNQFIDQTVTDTIPEPNLDPFTPEILPSPILPKKSKINFNFSFGFLKKIKIPKIRNIGWIILMILPFLFLIPFFFAKSNLTLFITPYQFEKTAPITFKVDSDPSQISNSIIPVKKQSFDVKATVTIPTTGQKTIGNKAKGEIIIYNKIDKTQNIPKGTIVTDSSGKKFELANAVSIASSSSNLDEGVITLGQTKTAVIASDIGSEFNLSKNTQLKFKDFADSIIIAKADSDFTGGSRQQVSAVSSQDKIDAQSKINQEIEKNIEDKIKNDLGNVDGIIRETIQTKKNNLELNREVGEEASELTATLMASVNVFTISNDVKNKLIDKFISSEENYNFSQINIKDFNLSFKVDQIDLQKAIGSLTVKGQSLPKVDTNQLKKNLVAKTNSSAQSVIKKLVPRAYNFHIDNNFPLGILPFRPENIAIEIKSESL